jgi:hypothetical protein
MAKAFCDAHICVLYKTVFGLAEIKRRYLYLNT